MAQPKTIVVTGASAGIGAAIARRLAPDNHRLVLAARREAELRDVADDAQRRGAERVLVVTADVTKRDDVLSLANAAIETFGGFDVWINNAGRGITKSVLDLTPDDLDAMMDVNVKSALYGMQVAAAHFLERGSGHVINISSFLGRAPLAPHRSAYNAAKAALNALTANLRVDLQSKNPAIHVTCVMPSMVATEFVRNAIGGSPSATLPSGSHVQTPDDVAEVVARAIDDPVAEVYTNPAAAEMASAYLADVGGFEAHGQHPWRTPPAPPR